MEVSPKKKNRIAKLPSIPTSEYTLEGNEYWIQNIEEIIALPCLLQHYSQYPTFGTNLMIHQWMKKERKCSTYVYIDTECCSAPRKKEGNPATFNKADAPPLC